MNLIESIERLSKTFKLLEGINRDAADKCDAAGLDRAYGEFHRGRAHAFDVCSDSLNAIVALDTSKPDKAA